MNTCLNLVNTNLALGVKKPALKLGSINNLSLAKELGITIFFNFILQTLLSSLI